MDSNELPEVTDEEALRPRLNADKSVTVPLRFPKMIGDEPLREVTVRRPTGADLRRLDQAKGDVDATFKLIEVLGLLPPSVVNKLDADDNEAIGTVIKGFTKRRQPLIEASSA